MTDLFSRTRTEFRRRQSEFLLSELEICSRNAVTASIMSRRGSRASADRSIADVEASYAELLRSLSDPEQTKRLTIKAKQELTEKVERLRQTLDELHSSKV